MRSDDFYMRHALELAAEGRGYTAPNPMVGAVVVKEDQIIGEGFHQRYGDPHAEAMALSTVSVSPKGATMYCTLEPCTPDIPGKKTPPCSKLLLREGIARLVIASIDPHPNVNGRGIQTLEAAGIQVETGCLAEDAIRLNEVYMKYCQTGLPFVHLKWASSLDGKIATQSGDSQWISDEDARREVHFLRHQYDSVLVGINTVLQDDPRLTIRHISGKQPWRIILDSNLRIPMDANVLTDNWREKTIIFCRKDVSDSKLRYLADSGVHVRQVSVDSDNRVSLPEVLKEIANFGVSSTLVEGGSEILTAFIKAKLFDKITAYIAPIILGDGLPAIGNLQIMQMRDRLRLEQTTLRTLNQQIVFEGYHQFKESFGIMTEHLTCLQES